MKYISVGDIFELKGRVPVLVTSIDQDSRTIKYSFRDGSYRLLNAGEFARLIIRRIGRMRPQFARIDKVMNLAAGC